MRRLPTSSGAFDDEESSWTAGLVPDAVVLRGLSVEVRGPDRMALGEPTRFRIAIRNRLPLPVSVTLPTSRLWGWQVDGVPEADERGYDAPDANRTVVFARGERKVFEAAWDGRIRRSSVDGDVWTDQEGPCEFTGYLAADDWERRGLYDRTEVVVEE
ncbi:hypothetical protein [Halorussus halobius]|uniref:hypothetical protein n=1 Tax=Halorussus halobius TaxID=1710537 RepID=UPI0010923CB4|nr:hypothetical protein [Halorussus halobius]